MKSKSVNGSLRGRVSTVKLVSRLEDGDWFPSGNQPIASTSARDLVRACVTQPRTQWPRKRNRISELVRVCPSMARKSSTQIDRISQFLRNACRGLEDPSKYLEVFEDLFSAFEDGKVAIPNGMIQLLLLAQANYNERTAEGRTSCRWYLGRVRDIRTLKLLVKSIYSSPEHK